MLSATLQKYRQIPALLWALLATQFLMNASHFMALPLLAVYMLKTLDFGPLQIGTIMTLNLVAAQALPLLTGLISDRLGFRPMMVAGLLLRAVGMAGFVLWHDWVALSAMAVLMGAGVSLYSSGVYGLFGRQPKPLAARIFILNNQMLNLGVILGPLLANTVSSVDIQLPFLVSGGLFVLLAIWVFALRDIDQWHGEPTAMITSLKRVATNRRFLAFLAVSLPWWFLFTQLYVAFPVHMIRLAGEAWVPSIFLVNGAVGFLFMLGSMVLLDRIRSSTLLPYAYLAAAILYGGAAFATTAWWFLIFVALYTMVETIMLPALETLTAELAAEGSQSTFFGALSLAWALAGAAGYYAGTWLSLRATPGLTWGIFALVGALGIALAAWFAATQGGRNTGPALLESRQ
ncbi:MAG: MFS transporter [Dongiaceae bacterium]